MNITTAMKRLVQDELNKRSGFNLTVDGDAGAKTQAALTSVSVIKSTWSVDRQIIAYIQHVATLEGIDAGPIDGLWGGQTDFAHDQLVFKRANGTLDNFRDDEDGDWPHQSQASMDAFYGEVGTNQGKCNSPYPLKLAWDLDKVVNRFTCHKKVAPIIERVLKKVLDHYGIDEIKRLRLDLWGGCLNVRKMRGSATKWSTHSWGTSIDWDPAHNRLKWGRDKASLAHSDYDFWWECWEEEGAVSLGRVQNRDWMHVQFARV